MALNQGFLFNMHLLLFLISVVARSWVVVFRVSGWEKEGTW